MADQTPNLSLDYLMPEQAQKHITINESLRRLDALVHLSVKSSTTSTPPSSPENGVRYLVPQGAQGAWAEHIGEIAFYEDTGWQFIAPRIGFRLWNESANALQVYNGNAWQEVSGGGTGGGGTSGGGSGLNLTRVDTTLVFPNPRALNIPSHVLFFGITGRVQSTFLGAARLRVGVAADRSRFASGVSRLRDSSFVGLADPPAVYWSQTAIRITGEGGPLTSGSIALSLYYLTLPIPS